MGFGFVDPKSKIELDWTRRFNICLGLAKALKYLHGEEDGVKILHRNIKASNILLDENCSAKLTDFGWAKVYNEEDPFLTIKAGGARYFFFFNKLQVSFTILEFGNR